MRNLTLAIALAVFAVSISSVDAVAQLPLITYGNNNEIELLENATNQRVDFFVSNISGKSYDTFEMFLIIGDGGSDAGGTDTGPRLTGVELGEAGTSFEGGTRGTFPSGQFPLLWSDFIDGVPNAVDGLLGTLIFDTTGITAGTSIDIKFADVTVGGVTFDSNFRGDGPGEIVDVASNGSIVVVVPEPSSGVLLIALAGLTGLRRRR